MISLEIFAISSTNLPGISFVFFSVRSTAQRGQAGTIRLLLTEHVCIKKETFQDDARMFRCF